MLLIIKVVPVSFKSLEKTTPSPRIRDHINLTRDYTWSGDAPHGPNQLRDLRLDQLTPSLPLQRAA